MPDRTSYGRPATSRTGERYAGGVLLDIRAVATLLNCSVRHIHRLRDGGRMPQPVKLGSLSRWRRSELEAWIADGCPTPTAARRRT